MGEGSPIPPLFFILIQSMELMEFMESVESVESMELVESVESVVSVESESCTYKVHHFLNSFLLILSVISQNFH